MGVEELEGIAGNDCEVVRLFHLYPGSAELTKLSQVNSIVTEKINF